MENENKNKDQKVKLEENQYDKDSPVEFVEKKTSQSKSTEDVKNRQEELEKFKRGELGAQHNRYNDDGTPNAGSPKMDIDTKADPKGV